MAIMKICFLSYEYAFESNGGIGVSTTILARQFATEHDVSVITAASDGVASSYEDHGVIVYAVPSCIVRLPILNYWFGDLIHKICYNVQAYKKLRELGKETIVFASEFGFEGLIPALKGWKVVTRLATPTFVDALYNRRKLSFQNRIISWCERKQTIVSAQRVAKTAFIRDYIAAQWGVPVERMKIIYNAIDVPDVIAKPAIDQEYLLFVGRIDKRKGADVLLKAFTHLRERFPSLYCVFVGKDLLPIVAESPKGNDSARVVHYQHVAHDELLAIMKGAAAVVVPSRFENCSMVCLEALALGRPLIVTEHTGAAELVEPGISGFTFPSEDAVGLAEVISHCLTHDMTEISRGAHNRAMRYSLENVCAEYEPILHSAGMRKEKRIAIIHDDLFECGGAQKLALCLARELGADIYTSVVSDEVRQMLPPSVRVVSLCNDETCDKDGLRRRRAFSELDIASEYDLFILSGEDALRAAHRHHPNLYYQHSIPAGLNHDIPSDLVYMKQAVSLYSDSISEKIWATLYRLKNKFSRAKSPGCISAFVEAIRYVCAHPSFFGAHDYYQYRLTEKNFKRDLTAADTILSNSCYTKQLLDKNFSESSKVVYPPVRTSDFFDSGKHEYWISVNRVHPLKRIEMQLEAFRDMPNETLYIVGSMIRDEYQDYYRKINELKPVNVTFLGVQSANELCDLLANAKGMIFTGRAEAFGMAPVEAMASGKPVIAPNEGGLSETVVHGKTGILIDVLTPESLVQSVQSVNVGPDRYSSACVARATLFDEKNFFEKMKEVIVKMI